MISIRSILVDIDAAAADHPALEQAISLALRCQSRLKIVDVLSCVPADVRTFVTPELERELIEHRRERLAAIAANVGRIEATAELLRGRPATALVQEVLRSGHDLLVRSHARDIAAGPRPFGAVDMELLRLCPCPVWLVARHDAHRPWRLLAAIHANPEDDAEQTLNARIVDWASSLYGLGDSQLTILQAWSAYGESVLQSRLPGDEFTDYVQAARRTAEDALTQFLKPLAERLPNVGVELVHGEPEDAITRFVESHGIDVVVMGTIARGGIAGVLMGNTAERVLQRLSGSVLAVKPPGFQTPVSKD